MAVFLGGGFQIDKYVLISIQTYIEIDKIQTV